MLTVFSTCRNIGTPQINAQQSVHFIQTQMNKHLQPVKMMTKHNTKAQNDAAREKINKLTAEVGAFYREIQAIKTH